jgi:phospholipid transport system substrate-binding protein
MKKLISLLLLILSTCIPSLSAAAADDDEAPDALVRRVTAEVLAIIKADKELQSGSMKKVNELVDTKILPHFNFTRMTALAVGQDWRTASPEQKAKLAAEFKTLLVRTYANALVSYKNQAIDVKPIKLAASETDVTVRTEVKQTSGQPIPLDYSLQKKDDGWKVYDVVVGGVSLVTNYRDEFKQTVRQNGIDGLIASLVTKNAQPAPAPAARK